MQEAAAEQLPLCVSVLSAAAAEYKNEGYYNKPDIAVVKKIAKAVIHKIFSLQRFESYCSSISYYAQDLNLVSDKFMQNSFCANKNKTIFLKPYCANRKNII